MGHGMEPIRQVTPYSALGLLTPYSQRGSGHPYAGTFWPRRFAAELDGWGDSPGPASASGLSRYHF
jgi:hypothetical protein